MLGLYNWAVHVQYEMLCNIIGSANVAKHLSLNERLLTKIRLAQWTNYTFIPAPRQEGNSFVDPFLKN